MNCKSEYHRLALQLIRLFKSAKGLRHSKYGLQSGGHLLEIGKAFVEVIDYFVLGKQIPEDVGELTTEALLHLVPQLNWVPWLAHSIQFNTPLNPMSQPGSNQTRWLNGRTCSEGQSSNDDGGRGR